MEKLKHILITGGIGVGKTTLVKKIIRLVERDIQGFYTRKIKLMNHEGESGIYIYNILSKEEEEEITCLATCNEGGPKKIHRERFDRYSEKYMEYNKEKIIIMDEIGFLENQSFSFQNKILQLLDGEIKDYLGHYRL